MSLATVVGLNPGLMSLIITLALTSRTQYASHTGASCTTLNTNNYLQCDVIMWILFQNNTYYTRSPAAQLGCIILFKHFKLYLCPFLLGYSIIPLQKYTVCAYVHVVTID